jgi:hypothetical protein
MTTPDNALDQLVPALAWEPDWSEVLRRAGHAERRRWFARRRVAVLVVALVAVVIPLAALAAVKDWWFFRYGAAPTPAQAPVVVRTGEWEGHPWELSAYPSTTNGLCLSLTPTPAYGAVLGCAPIAGAPRSPETEPMPEMSITYLTGDGGRTFPPYVVGAVVEGASQVEIRFDDGRTLRVPTFAAPQPLEHVRFFATRAADANHVRSVAGLDEAGAVVACLVPETAESGVSPPADCR